MPNTQTCYKSPCVNNIQLNIFLFLLQSNPKWKTKKRKSSHPEEENDVRTVTHCVAFGSTTGKVLIYSITHAKVESVLEDPNPTPGEQDISCMDWSKKQGLFTCSSDSTIRQWSIQDGSVKTKFRMSKFEKGTQSAKTTAIKIPNYQVSIFIKIIIFRHFLYNCHTKVLNT